MYSSVTSYVTFLEFVLSSFSLLSGVHWKDITSAFYYKWTFWFPIFCFHKQCCEYSWTGPWYRCASLCRAKLLSVCAIAWVGVVVSKGLSNPLALQQPMGNEAFGLESRLGPLALCLKQTSSICCKCYTSKTERVAPGPSYSKCSLPASNISCRNLIKM